MNKFLKKIIRIILIIGSYLKIRIIIIIKMCFK